MRFSIIILVIAIILSASQPVNGQNDIHQISIETEPVAYILGGAGITGAYQYSSWTYSIEAFGGLTVPESLHGNQGFDTSLKGIELQIERFLSGNDGFYAGPEFGVSELEVTDKSTGNSKRKTGYSIGFRGGYHWDTELGNLYLNPLVGISYALNSEEIQIENQTFESGSVTPFATVGVGWTFN